MERAHNLLNELLIHTTPTAALSLPGVLAGLARDEIESFPALRPHQMPAWHMFLVQLAALSLHAAGRVDIPEEEAEWCQLLRGLTADYPADEPWCLAVEDRSKPAFLQPPMPEDAKPKDVPTPDALDVLMTSKNHDLKKAVARESAPEDWLFALISLQTQGGWGGRDNYGITRMNGNFSSRVLLGLAPLRAPSQQDLAPRPGAWFRRDLRYLLETREDVSDFCGIDYPDRGIGLTWLQPWPEGAQLRMRDLDLWFIEACRRVRLVAKDGSLNGVRGTSKAARIDAKQANGVLCDPWAPVHKTKNTSLSLNEDGRFNYARLTDLLFSGDWELPLLARPASFERQDGPLLLAAAALARGQKTGGFQSRFVPLSAAVSAALRTTDKREKLHELAKEQVQAIAGFERALSFALALVLANGEHEKARDKSGKVKPALYERLREPRAHLDRFADDIFFPHLWRRFEVKEAGDSARQQEEWLDFAGQLWKRTDGIFWQFLPAMPCAALYRHRAEARAESALRAMVRKTHPELFQKAARETEGEGEHAN
ncbi:MAG: CRISPR-associated protein Cse1 [Alphaproteobacteria bacterium]|nr:CRISPR-associated protein Cse1 [Alphaproteobacteria bacterium]MBU0799075.1 CRISPR-associated protein Cse1 [Alphaproteobacteria bacterium]MBU0885593.1 CRISPR-associated protein Cse1 [Alphaproteobacteria bacterium]MBU1813752.1 CRISPR-associated protein Cse1 [Alphaproteobacteria bacterium]MBU2091435.1 CRISPR-associated protein Cse1 [Alphaproteobacteria bacterium]